MSTGTVILLVLVLAAVAVAAGTASTLAQRRAARRQQAGPEFSRLARETGPRRARAEFAARRRRVDGLGLKQVPPERHSVYLRRWGSAQGRFIDSPPQAVLQAAALVAAVAAERGYDASDSGQLLVDLSVYHGQYLDGHRRAIQTTEQGTATTEELRQALLGHRGLFLDLLAAPAAAVRDRAASPGEPGNREGRRPGRAGPGSLVPGPHGAAPGRRRHRDRAASQDGNEGPARDGNQAAARPLSRS